MAYEKVNLEEVRAMLDDIARQIERGGLKSATIRWCTTSGDEREITFLLETEEDRTEALHAIRTVLGQVH